MELNNQPINEVWNKNGRKANSIFFILGVLLVFTLDLYIVITNPSLMIFWLVMLFILVVNGIFIAFENYFSKKNEDKETTKIDRGISILIVLRNLVFIINTLPVIQLLGLAIAGFAGIPYFIIYLILFLLRNRKTATKSSSNI